MGFFRVVKAVLIIHDQRVLQPTLERTSHFGQTHEQQELQATQTLNKRQRHKT